jgi:hypothetical protein
MRCVCLSYCVWKVEAPPGMARFVVWGAVELFSLKLGFEAAC